MTFPNQRDKRAVGVEFTSDPVSCPDMDQSLSTVRASKLVVISAGAFGSPTILERSGIGAESILERCDIEQVANLPGVGENYQGLLSFIHFMIIAYDHQITMPPVIHTLLLTVLLQWTPSGAGTRVLYRVNILSPYSQLFLTTKMSTVENLAQWKSNGGTLIAEKLVQVIALVMC